MKIIILLAIFSLFSGDLFSLSAAEKPNSPEDWTFMPAGAKPSYMGIHGGTMPVSLLVSDDGESLLTFVGRTGNDFLEALRNVHLPLPSFGNSTGFGMPHLNSSASLFAGNATATLPVFSVSGDAIAHLNLEPFGLSHEPLSIEGSVAKPDSFPHARVLRPFFLRDYFQPRKLQK